VDGLKSSFDNTLDRSPKQRRQENMSTIPSTVDRVPQHTAEDINCRIDHDINDRIRYLAQHPTGIERRLRELDEEWDIERALEANAASVAFTGTLVAATVDKRWFVVPALVGAFLFQHAVQGWCPPVPILRRLGYRTSREIETERIALKALRGDFGKIGPADGEGDTEAGHALQAARL
jgi:Protein of unknown function (DUF2892)